MMDLERQNLLDDLEPVDNMLIDNCLTENCDNSDHCHALLLKSKSEKNAERALLFVALLSAVFIIAEFVGGYLANSLSIITDAGHMLSDFFSFVISLIMLRVSRLPANKRASFGFARAEILGALMSILIIWTLTILLVVFAVQRILSGRLDVEVNTMLITAVLGVFFNIVMAGVLMFASRKSGGAVGHSHSCHTSGNSSCETHNLNVRAAFIHVLGDFVQSLGVLCAAIVIKFTGWTLADPLCTFLFSVIVICTSLPVFSDIWVVLMEATPRNIDYSSVYQDLLKVDNSIRQIHSLHIWALSGRRHCSSVHIVIDDKSLSDMITNKATRHLQHKYNIMHTTVQIELLKPLSSDNLNFDCDFCKPLS